LARKSKPQGLPLAATLKVTVFRGLNKCPSRYNLLGFVVLKQRLGLFDPYILFVKLNREVDGA